ncbi:unnamed protein product [Amoebophrya sp. A120]|nr:unnamed protein product [Amoebophrya sp. A120]|eukprot:GSA120T00009590001.1
MKNARRAKCPAGSWALAWARRVSKIKRSEFYYYYGYASKKPTKPAPLVGYVLGQQPARFSRMRPAQFAQGPRILVAARLPPPACPPARASGLLSMYRGAGCAVLWSLPGACIGTASRGCVSKFSRRHLPLLARARRVV